MTPRPPHGNVLGPSFFQVIGNAPIFISKVKEALEQWHAAQRLHSSLKAAHVETRAAYRRLAGLDAKH